MPSTCGIASPSRPIRTYPTTPHERGHEWNGVSTLLLTTKGRKSGKWRRTALIYGRDGERYVVVASQGGAPTHPSWFLNLVANPVVHLQVGSQRFTATARPVSGAERARLWKLMAGIWTYDEYQAKTDREIPVVVIERTD